MKSRLAAGGVGVLNTLRLDSCVGRTAGLQSAAVIRTGQDHHRPDQMPNALACAAAAESGSYREVCMSSKSDRDNRSNQLNPNNAAYASARSWHRDDDDDGYDSIAARHEQCPPLSPITWGDDVRDYALGFVGSHGQVRLIRFQLSVKTLVASVLNRPDAKHEDFLEHFCENVSRLFRGRWREIALRMAFDGRGEVIEWMTWSHPLRRQLERCDEVDPVCPAGTLVKPGEIVEARELLLRAATPPFEHWGRFQIPSQRSSLSFVYEQRCRELVAG